MPYPKPRSSVKIIPRYLCPFPLPRFRFNPQHPQPLIRIRRNLDFRVAPLAAPSIAIATVQSLMTTRSVALFMTVLPPKMHRGIYINPTAHVFTAMLSMPDSPWISMAEGTIRAQLAATHARDDLPVV